jgi:Flp pilus assembly protein TadD
VFASPGKRNLILSLLIVAATLAIYNPVNSHPFVNYDDDRYVTENTNVRTGLTLDTVRWAFTSTYQANWHPLTWLSHALDCQLFRLNPAGHHFTSLAIHAVNAAFLFLLLIWATERLAPSLFVAGLFALHPINIESVAWIAERKNVLCTFFFFGALAAYGWYAKNPSWRRYLAVIAMFACSLMSKPMAVTLPFVLLLLDYWPLARAEGTSNQTLALPQRKWTFLVAEKVPLLLMSAASSVITMHAQAAGGAVRSTLSYSLTARIENAIVTYGTYLWKLVWPAKLAPLYPHPLESLPGWQIVASGLVLLGFTALAFRIKRHALVGWLWFLGTLVPVIGLIQVGDAAMADRYAYIPAIGIFTAVAFGLDNLAMRMKLTARAKMIPAVSIILIFGILTLRQLSYWESSDRLWSHTVRVTGPNYIAQDNLGGALVLLGKTEEAYPHFVLAAQINPRDPMSHSNLGAYLQEHGQTREAMQEYQTAISLTSDGGLLSSTYANLGSAYRSLSQDDAARRAYETALQLNPANFNAYLGMGLLAENKGSISEAIADYTRSLEIAPTPEGYYRLGQALEKSSRKEEALAAYQQALKLAPDLQEAQEAVKALSVPK